MSSEATLRRQMNRKNEKVFEDQWNTIVQP